MNLASYPMLGSRVQALTIEDLNALIATAIAGGERKVFLTQNVHSLYCLQRDETLREFYGRADHVLIDGMPLVFLGRLLGMPLRREHRVAYLDWLGPLLAEAERSGWRVFFLAATPAVLDRATAILRQRYPAVQLTAHSGYFDARPGSAENEAVVEAIKTWRTQLLIVGMGMPREQRWILEHRDRLAVNAISNCGAVLDYVAGAIPTPPRWTGPLGIEWAFRLVAEPRRLAKRYLAEPWSLAPAVLRDLLQHWRR